MNVISTDPALASKILRMANSPLYGQQKEVESLSKAILVMGLNSSISLALSFSLVKSMNAVKSHSLDYDLFWRRTYLAGATSRILGNVCGTWNIEELFIATLLQDIGMLVLDQVSPGLYEEGSLDQTQTRHLIAHEQHILGVHHGTVGGWLLEQWNLSERLVMAVRYSEDTNQIPPDYPQAIFIRSVSWCALLAELFLRNSKGQDLDDLVILGEQWLRLKPADVSGILEKMDQQIPEIENLFDTELRSTLNAEWLIESSREVLLDRSLQITKKVEELEISKSKHEPDTQALVDASRRDPLTGLVDRTSLDNILIELYKKSGVTGEPLSVVFAEVDQFTEMQDEYGHDVGEKVLPAVAKVLTNHVRPSDVVGRFGGNEFVVLLPNTTVRGVEITALRLLEAFRESKIEVGLENELDVSLPIGVITHGEDQYFINGNDLVQKAGQAMFAAKSKGGNTWVAFTPDLFTSGTP